VHDGEPLLPLYVPAAHERHAAEDVLAVLGLYVPDAQERHAAEDVLAVLIL
jgi:hypothetical protein